MVSEMVQKPSGKPQAPEQTRPAEPAEASETWCIVAKFTEGGGGKCGVWWRTGASGGCLTFWYIEQLHLLHYVTPGDSDEGKSALGCCSLLNTVRAQESVKPQRSREDPGAIIMVSV